MDSTKKYAVFMKNGGEKTVGVFVLCVILFYVGWQDICHRKVSNLWLLVGTLFGIWYNGLSFFLPASMMLVISFFCFSMGFIGAGDGKLMALIAGYLGIEGGIKAISGGMCVGAVWALCLLWQKRNFRTRLNYLSAYLWRIFLMKNITVYGELPKGDGKNSIPLAACLGVGTYLFLLYSQVLAPERGIL